MLQKNIVLIISFITLAFIISLFPPYAWGDEQLKTEKERQRIKYYYEDKLPFKQYDFLFNDIKKEFNFGNNKITLERHLIFSELFIQLFLAFLLSVLIQFLYRKFSYKFSIILIPVLTSIIGVIIILSSFNLFASWFQPDYSIVENEKEKIKNVYSAYLESYSLSEIILILDEFNNGYHNDWSYKTREFWNEVKNTILVDVKSLPKIENFLAEKIKKKSRWNYDFSYLYKDDIEKEFPIYQNYLPPKDFKVNYYLLDNDIEKIKYRTILQSKSGIPHYLKIKNQYVADFQNYWDINIPKIKTYTIIIFPILILILFMVYRKKILLKLQNV